MGLSAEQKKQVVVVRRLLSALDIQHVQQGYALLLSLQDVSVAEVFVDGISIDACGRLTISDAARRKKHLSKPVRRIGVALMAMRAAGKLDAITALDLSECWQVNDIRGIEGLTQLTTLNLADRITRDTVLRSLKTLTGLTALNLAHNQLVRDLVFLTSLTGLTALNLSSTGVRNLRPLAHLASLETLDLSNTGVHDLRPLTHLQHLKTVSVVRCHAMPSTAIQSLQSALPDCTIEQS